MARFSTVLGAVLPNVIEVVKRFPFAVLFSALLTSWLLRTVMHRLDTDFIAYALLSLFFAAVGLKLISERRGWSLGLSLTVSLIVFLLLGLVFYFEDGVGLTPVMMIVTIAIAGSTMLYLFEGGKRKKANEAEESAGEPASVLMAKWRAADNRKYWLFNHQYWFSFTIAILGGLLVAGLVALLIGAYATLFDTNVYSRVYSYTFIVSLFLISPLFWLSMLPDDFDEEVSEGEPVEFTSKVTGLFVKYLFVPFFFLFVLLFHGLAVKIGIDGAFPKGQLGWYGLALVIGTIGTYLMAFPTRNVSGPLVKLFTKQWIWFLIVPLGLIMTAHFIRIEEYGMTPLRYYLAGLFLWALVLIGYTLLVRVRGGVFDLRVILYLAMLVLGLSSFGPFGAEAVSSNWQKSRLINLLSKQGVLENGVIVKALPEESEAGAETVRKVRQTLNFFRTRRRGEALSSLLSLEARASIETGTGGAAQKSGRNNETVLAVWDALGADAKSYGSTRRNHFNFRANTPTYFPGLGKGELMGLFYYHFNQKRTASKAPDASLKSVNKTIKYEGRSLNLTYQLEGDQFVVLLDGEKVGEVSQQAIIDLAKADMDRRSGTAQRRDVLILELTGEGAAGSKLYVTNLSYRQSVSKKDDVAITMIGFWLYKAR